ncbi:MAG: class I SAM-dependent methyltransferase [Patescibacteria group bacterium]
MSIFFKNNIEQTNYIKEKLKKAYPDFKTGGYFFIKYLKTYINNESIVLDAGCGDNGMTAELKSIPKSIIGIDVSAELLSRNSIVSQKLLAVLNRLLSKAIQSIL